MIKIGLVGTNSSGKSTLCYEIMALLKKHSVRCDAVLKQDRRGTLTSELLDKEPLAHYGLIGKHIYTECDLAYRAGVEVLICDRTPLDYYAYYVATFGWDADMRIYVANWMKTYDKIYVLRPLPYEEDPGRPSRELREKMYKSLIQIVNNDDLGCQKKMAIEPAVELYKVKEWRTKIVNEILNQVREPILLTRDLIGELRTYFCPVRILVGGSYATGTATKLSDIDIYYIKSDSQWADGNSNLKTKSGIKINVETIQNEYVFDYLKYERGFIEL